MAHLIAAGVHGRGLVVVKRLVRLGLLVVGIIATVRVLMRLTIGCRVGADGAIVVIVAGGSWRRRISLEFESKTAALYCRASEPKKGGVESLRHTFALRHPAISRAHAWIVVLRRRTAHKHRIIGMGLDVLLQILRALERLSAKLALVRLERHVDPNVRSDVVALDGRGAAARPLTREVQVVGALAANMTLTDMILFAELGLALARGVKFKAQG
jgi:hypothetical protein